MRRKQEYIEEEKKPQENRNTDISDSIVSSAGFINRVSIASNDLS